MWAHHRAACIVADGVDDDPLMDSALSLAIGAIAKQPSNPSTIFVVPVKVIFPGDSFFGVAFIALIMPIHAGSGWPVE